MKNVGKTLDFDRIYMLMRHGEVDRDNGLPPKYQGLNQKRKNEVVSIAKTLAETLTNLPDKNRICIGQIWSSEYAHANETAKILARTLADPRDTNQKRELNPDKFLREWNKTTIKNFVIEMRHILQLQTSQRNGRNAILVVGHQPQLSWLAHELTRKPVPIDRSELVCIAESDTAAWMAWMRGREQQSWILWTLSPTNNQRMKELRAKIQSKMDTAKLLGAINVPILGFILGAILDRNKYMELTTLQKDFLGVSILLFLVSICLYLTTVYAYDRLLMPTSLWGEKPAQKRPKWLVWRPPSSASWVLYQNMMRIWYRRFTGASFAVFFGLLFLALAVFAGEIFIVKESAKIATPVGNITWWVLLIVILIIAGALVCHWTSHPILGSED